MSANLNYFMVAQKDRRKGKDPDVKVWSVRTSNPRVVGNEELANRISGRCTAALGDVRLVLTELGLVMQEMISNGEAVKVENLGTFRACGSSFVVESYDEFKKKNYFKAPRLRFQACTKLRASAASCGYSLKDGFDTSKVVSNATVIEPKP